MFESIRRRCPWFPAVLLLAGALAVGPAAFARAPKIAYPAKAKVGKVKPADWVGNWFQWFLAVPVDSNTFYDTNGAYAAVGQRGPVWFLTLGSPQDQITRTVKVPAGVALFFPIIYSQFDNAGQIPSAWLTSADLYAAVKGDIDAVDATGYFCTVDGTPLADLAKRRIQSSVFAYGVAPNTNPTFFNPAPAVGDVINPAVADGYWVMLSPMAVGNHVVTYGRSTGNGNDDWILTYDITVAAPQQ